MHARHTKIAREKYVRGELFGILLVWGLTLTVGWGGYGWLILSDNNPQKGHGESLFLAIFLTAIALWMSRRVPRLLILRKRGAFTQGTIAKRCFWIGGGEDRKWMVEYVVEDKKYRRAKELSKKRKMGDAMAVLYDPR